ncbi:DMT family transporter [Pinirhizobacter soli]|uniref:DMT family transporter n=1 Tax=Pinirhizobacter soli TaxID=2786953 RepID=UPI00202AA228|nr:DMT family transporter [Pinirhizobacter soli]
MIWIILSVCCSVLVSVLLRLARGWSVDARQAIAFNYLSAGLLTWLLLRPAMPSVQQPASVYVAFVGLGVLLPAVFVALARSVTTAGIVRSEIAQRLSLVVSLTAAAVLFGDVPTAAKAGGMALGLIAVVLAIAGRRDGSPRGASHWPWLVFVGFGVIDVLLKFVAQSGTSFPAVLLSAFVLALMLSLIALLASQTTFTLRNFGAGLVLGAANFANIYCYIRGHQALAAHPSLVFSTVNIGVVVLGALVGIVAFGERPGPMRMTGLALALVAIVAISLA